MTRVITALACSACVYYVLLHLYNSMPLYQP